MFNTGRALSGLGEGIYLSSMSVYICEIAPSKYRGILAGLPQFMATLAICAGYFTCYGTVGINSSFAWRIPYSVQVALAVLLAVGCWLLPDSPRWLMLHGRRAEALAALAKLDFVLEEEEHSFLTSNDQGINLSAWQSIRVLFSRAYRARTVLALFILGMVQLSGIDGVLYVSSASRGTVDATATDAAIVCATTVRTSGPGFADGRVPGFWLVRYTNAGRLYPLHFCYLINGGVVPLAMTGGIGLAGCMLLMGTLYAAGVVHPYGIARWIVIVLVFIFGMTYCATWGIVGKIYASEIQPSNTRAVANCVAQGLGFVRSPTPSLLVAILLTESI